MARDGGVKTIALNEVEIKLALVDLVSPYGVIGREIFPFIKENTAILQLSSQERKQALCDLADKIKKYYGKTELAETKTRRG